MAAGAISAPLIVPITDLLTHKPKNHIHTRTPVSIQSDSAGVLIFFTLDGSKPVAGQRGSEGSSRKYTGPILLPAGRVSIRAVAVTRDGRQSSVVTKVFSVDQVGPEAKEDSLQSRSQHQCAGASCSDDHAAGSAQTCADSEPRLTGSGPPPPLSGPRFLDRRLGSKGSEVAAAAAGTGPPRRSRSADSHELKQLSSTQVSRVQRDTHFLWCPRCLCIRPSDPFARFCPQCGAVIPPVPALTLPPAERGQLPCPSCHSLVPINTRTCLICEASIDGHQQLQAGLTLQVSYRTQSVSYLWFTLRGSGSGSGSGPCGVRFLWTVEPSPGLQLCNLRGPPVCAGWSGGRRRPLWSDSRWQDVVLLQVQTLNRGDARFCNWCGSKPGHALDWVTCWQCGASGHPYAPHCTACGVFLQAQAPPPTSNKITQPEEGATHSPAPWKAPPPPSSAPRLRVAPPSVDQATQTVGLYYPSATELQKRDQQRALQLIQELATRDRRPLLTAISPGRGYWRKQLDHVCAHLRSYTQNHSSFRTLLAEPRLGQMISGAVQEDQDEVTLTLSFTLATLKHQQVDPHGDLDGPAGGSVLVGQVQTLSSVTERSADRTGLRSARRKLQANPKPRPSATDSQLLKELGPDGGRIRTIQQLLDQGADPSCCGIDGRHALAVAVVNGHHSVLPVLVRQGAAVDQQSGPMKNTALHEAAALGPDGLQSAKLLLRCQASVRWRNAAGQTAYDVAVNSGCSDMVSLLAAQTGLGLLGELGLSQLNLDVF
ncbi:LOW QUALITY PROTEIN: double zinc ribbon and ankyrin repeat-containing protein 1 [Anableps anableps]